MTVTDGDRETANVLLEAAHQAMRVARDNLNAGQAILRDTQLNPAEQDARTQVWSEHWDVEHPDGSACFHGKHFPNEF